MKTSKQIKMELRRNQKLLTQTELLLNELQSKQNTDAMYQIRLAQIKIIARIETLNWVKG